MKLHDFYGKKINFFTGIFHIFHVKTNGAGGSTMILRLKSLQNQK